MAFFQVTASELRQKAEELVSLNQRLSSESENLVNAHNSLKATWEGEANEAFSREFLRDKTHIDNFISAVSQYAEALNSISSKYDEAENKNLSLAGTRTY